MGSHFWTTANAPRSFRAAGVHALLVAFGYCDLGPLAVLGDEALEALHFRQGLLALAGGGDLTPQSGQLDLGVVHLLH